MHVERAWHGVFISGQNNGQDDNDEAIRDRCRGIDVVKPDRFGRSVIDRQMYLFKNVFLCDTHLIHTHTEYRYTSYKPHDALAS